MVVFLFQSEWEKNCGESSFELKLNNIIFFSMCNQTYPLFYDEILIFIFW